MALMVVSHDQLMHQDAEWFFRQPPIIAAALRNADPRPNDRWITRRRKGSSLPGPAGAALRSATPTCRPRADQERHADPRSPADADQRQPTRECCRSQWRDPGDARPHAGCGIVQRERNSQRKRLAAGDHRVSGRYADIVKRSEDCPNADRADDRRAERCCQGGGEHAGQRVTGRHRACGRGHRDGRDEQIRPRGDPGIAHTKRHSGREIVEVRPAAISSAESQSTAQR